MACGIDEGLLFIDVDLKWMDIVSKEKKMFFTNFGSVEKLRRKQLIL